MSTVTTEKWAASISITASSTWRWSATASPGDTSNMTSRANSRRPRMKHVSTGEDCGLILIRCRRGNGGRQTEELKRATITPIYRKSSATCILGPSFAWPYNLWFQCTQGLGRLLRKSEMDDQSIRSLPAGSNPAVSIENQAVSPVSTEEAAGCTATSNNWYANHQRPVGDGLAPRYLSAWNSHEGEMAKGFNRRSRRLFHP